MPCPPSGGPLSQRTRYSPKHQRNLCFHWIIDALPWGRSGMAHARRVRRDDGELCPAQPKGRREHPTLLHRKSASLIGRLGQARFPCRLGFLPLIRGTLLFAVWLVPRGASLHACVGLVVESLALRRAWWRSRHFRLHPRTSSGEDDPVQIDVGRSDHAMPSTFSGRNSEPSAHMRWSRTASLRATATTARRRPLVRIKRMPQDLICDPVMVRISKALAAA